VNQKKVEVTNDRLHLDGIIDLFVLLGQLPVVAGDAETFVQQIGDRRKHSQARIFS
jgi:hypothetical protein